MINTLVRTAEVSYERALPEQAEELTTLVNSAYRGETSRAGWTTEDNFLDGQRTDPEMIREMIADPANQVIWLARDERGALIGSVHLERFGDEALLSMLTVKPGAQGRGLGRQLIEFAEDFVRREWHCPKLRMTVISLRHELIAYYERRGYRATGEVRDFPHDNSRYGLPKRRDFHLIVLEKSLSSRSSS